MRNGDATTLPLASTHSPNTVSGGSNTYRTPHALSLVLRTRVGQPLGHNPARFADEVAQQSVVLTGKRQQHNAPINSHDSHPPPTWRTQPQLNVSHLHQHE